jgi:hypothetical protein
MKTCPRCERELDAAAFGRSTLSSDGLQGWCKACKNARARETRRQRRTMPRLKVAGPPSSAAGRKKAIENIMNEFNVSREDAACRLFVTTAMAMKPC